MCFSFYMSRLQFHFVTIWQQYIIRWCFIISYNGHIHTDYFSLIVKFGLHLAYRPQTEKSHKDNTTSIFFLSNIYNTLHAVFPCTTAKYQHMQSSSPDCISRGASFVVCYICCIVFLTQTSGLYCSICSLKVVMFVLCQTSAKLRF